MKKAGKFLVYGVFIILLLLVVALAYISWVLPSAGKPEDIKVTVTPLRVAHGKYLAMHVTVCIDCHSTRDWNTFAAPIDTNSIAAGGELFNDKVDFPGEVYSPNITPYNLNSWTDGELFRAITCGVKKNGSAIFPLMPWPYYSKMDREDIYDIIAYIRTLKPLKSEYPERKLNFPLNFIVNTMPQKAQLSNKPKESDTIKYGAYLVQAAACKQCHTQDHNGQLLEGMDFAGGHEFKLAGITVRSANITPDKQDGIGNWTMQHFVDRFKKYTAKEYSPKMVGTGDFQTVMPWMMYGGMKVSDLQAVYAYLKTIKPVANNVVKFDKTADVK